MKRVYYSTISSIEELDIAKISILSFKKYDSLADYIIYIIGEEKDLIYENGVLVIKTLMEENIFMGLLKEYDQVIKTAPHSICLKEIGFDKLDYKPFFIPGKIEKQRNNGTKNDYSEELSHVNYNFVICNSSFFSQVDWDYINSIIEKHNKYLFNIKDYVSTLLTVLVHLSVLDYHKISLLYNKNFNTIKVNDKIDNYYIFNFKGEYKPWKSLVESSYGLDAIDKVNLLFFDYWYQINKEYCISDTFHKTEELNNKQVKSLFLRLSADNINLFFKNKEIEKKDKKINKNFFYKSIIKMKYKILGYDNKFILHLKIGSKVFCGATIKRKRYEKRIRIINENEKVIGKVFLKIPFKNYYIYFFALDYSRLYSMDSLQNEVKLHIGNRKLRILGRFGRRVDNYNHIHSVHYTKYYIYYLRRGFKGNLIIQKKKREKFETKTFQMKVFIAYFVSKFNKKRKYNLFYEKNAEKFEESASRVFKNVADRDNVRFVIKSDSKDFALLKNEYGNKIVSPGSYKFALTLFKAKAYIGTEAPIHMFGIRSGYKYLRKEIMGNNGKFIFLQHGITYSLSLKTSARAIFKKNSIYNPHKIVVCSEKEKKHWMEYGNYDSSDLWLTGMATFDNKKINVSSDKVVLMITWRPWEEVAPNIFDTTYYQAIDRIAKEIKCDDELFEKLVIVAHPKISLENADSWFSDKIYNGKIDDILNEADVLITDYSSVCYDSFYRGSKVIFWWEELDMVLPKYPNKIMLNKTNIFGDICWDSNDLLQIIQQNYLQTRQKHYIDNYNKLNEYHDDKNTDRIIYYLEKENFIEKREVVSGD